MYSRQQKRALLDSAKGQFFSVKFKKKDNSIREMVCKKYIEAYLTYGKENVLPNPVAHKEEYYTVAEMDTESFKNINLDTLISAKIGGKEYKFGE